MGFMAARLGDPHVCPMFDGPKPHVGGPVLPPTQATVLTGKMPQARFMDKLTCVGPPDMFAKGSPTVIVVGQMAARAMVDMTMHGGMCVVGCPTVLIGDVGVVTPGMADVSVLAGFGSPATGAIGEQTKGMIEAAKQGAPFVEQCSKA